MPTPLDDTRSLIFANLLNGVPVEQVMRVYQKSEKETLDTFSFVLRKVKSYCFERSLQKNAMPIVIASSISEAKRYRLTCLSVLPKLNLDTSPKYKDIQGELIKPSNYKQVMRNIL